MAGIQLPTNFEALIVLVFGRIGVGKSSFINSIANSDLAVGQNLSATTTTPECKFATIDGVKVAFVDTPGFNNPDGRSDAQIITEVIDWVQENLGGKRGLTAVIDLRSIKDNDFYSSALNNFDPFLSLAGGKSRLHVCLGSTHWDDFLYAEGISKEACLKAKSWNSLLRQGAAEPHRLRNTYVTSYRMLQQVLLAQQAFARAVELAREESQTTGLEYELAGARTEIERSKDEFQLLETRLGELKVSQEELGAQIAGIKLELERQSPLELATCTQTVLAYLKGTLPPCDGNCVNLEWANNIIKQHRIR